MSKKELVIVLSLTAFVILVWVVSEIIHTKPSVETDQTLQERLGPVDPQFDQATIDLLNKPPSLPEVPQVTRSTPTPTPRSSPLTSPSPSATGSASPSPSI